MYTGGGGGNPYFTLVSKWSNPTNCDFLKLPEMLKSLLCW